MTQADGTLAVYAPLAFLARWMACIPDSSITATHRPRPDAPVNRLQFGASHGGEDTPTDEMSDPGDEEWSVPDARRPEPGAVDIRPCHEASVLNRLVTR
jgi:hypothetical protein